MFKILFSFFVAIVFAQPVYGLPNAGNNPNVGVSTETSNGGKTLTINLSSDDARGQWNSFNIAADEAVVFNQSSANALYLLSVTSNEKTQIAGSLTANGRLVLENQAGIHFQASAVVNVGALIAVAGTISNARNPVTNAKELKVSVGNGDITNDGALTVTGQQTVFISKTFNNNGTITSSGGDIEVLVGASFTLTASGSGSIGIQVDSRKLGALINNKGTLTAQSGEIKISAHDLHQLGTTVVNIGGTMSANKITIRGSQNIVELSGSALAQTGISIYGAYIHLLDDVDFESNNFEFGAPATNTTAQKTKQILSRAQSWLESFSDRARVSFNAEQRLWLLGSITLSGGIVNITTRNVETADDIFTSMATDYPFGLIDAYSIEIEKGALDIVSDADIILSEKRLEARHELVLNRLYVSNLERFLGDSLSVNSIKTISALPLTLEYSLSLNSGADISIYGDISGGIHDISIQAGDSTMSNTASINFLTDEDIVLSGNTIDLLSYEKIDFSNTITIKASKQIILSSDINTAARINLDAPAIELALGTEYHLDADTISIASAEVTSRNNESIRLTARTEVFLTGDFTMGRGNINIATEVYNLPKDKSIVLAGKNISLSGSSFAPFDYCPPTYQNSGALTLNFPQGVQTTYGPDFQHALAMSALPPLTTIPPPLTLPPPPLTTISPPPTIPPTTTIPNDPVPVVDPDPNPAPDDPVHDDFVSSDPAPAPASDPVPNPAPDPVANDPMLAPVFDSNFMPPALPPASTPTSPPASDIAPDNPERAPSIQPKIAAQPEPEPAAQPAAQTTPQLKKRAFSNSELSAARRITATHQRPHIVLKRNAKGKLYFHGCAGGDKVFRLLVCGYNYEYGR